MHFIGALPLTPITAAHLRHLLGPLASSVAVENRERVQVHGATDAQPLAAKHVCDGRDVALAARDGHLGQP